MISRSAVRVLRWWAMWSAPRWALHSDSMSAMTSTLTGMVRAPRAVMRTNRARPSDGSAVRTAPWHPLRAASCHHRPATPGNASGSGPLMQIAWVTFLQVPSDDPGCRHLDATNDYTACTNADQADDGAGARYHCSRDTHRCEPRIAWNRNRRMAGIGDRLWRATQGRRACDGTTFAPIRARAEAPFAEATTGHRDVSVVDPPPTQPWQRWARNLTIASTLTCVNPRTTNNSPVNP